jgi:glutaredoxin
MKTILVFTLNGCERCAELKNKMKELNVSFHDVEITKNRKLWNAVKGQIGYDILPTVFIQIDDIGNGTVYTPGRDFQDVNEIIEIIKKNI